MGRGLKLACRAARREREREERQRERDSDRDRDRESESERASERERESEKANKGDWVRRQLTRRALDAAASDLPLGIEPAPCGGAVACES